MSVSRVLRRRGRASGLALIALTLGIGLPAALFSVLDGVALRGLPFPEGHRAAWISTYRGYNLPMPVQDYLAIAERQRAFSEVAAFRSYNAVLTLEGGSSKGLHASSHLDLINESPRPDPAYAVVSVVTSG